MILAIAENVCFAASNIVFFVWKCGKKAYFCGVEESEESEESEENDLKDSANKKRLDIFAGQKIDKRHNNWA